MIKIDNVSFAYEGSNNKGSIENINLEINEGEVVILCGESGCGKTTLTRLINGLIPNYYEGTLSGEVLINGQKVNELPLYETAKLVGSVFQNPRSQFFNVDTTSELAFGCENKGLPIEEIKNRISETVDELKIDKLMNRSIFNLSGGEKQKIACASVSVCRPDIFVLDEPSSNLDVVAIEDLRKLIAVWKSRKKTIVIAEHRLYFLRELADRIVYIKNGKIEKEFSCEQIKRLSESEVSALGLRPLSLKQISIKQNKAITTYSDKLEMRNLIFSYKYQPPAIDICSLNVPKDNIIAIIGNNGAGKSTFARCLCGLEKHCMGTMTFNCCNCKIKECLKRCYMVMQDVNHQLFTESVLDEVLLSMKEPDKEKAEKILQTLDLLEMKDLHPMSLSGGQKQRVAIASAVASEREIILFDEPTSGLDLRHMKEVADSLCELQKMGKTLFVISHDLELILECCTYVLHLKNGKEVGNYPIDKLGEQKLIDFFTSNNK